MNLGEFMIKIMGKYQDYYYLNDEKFDLDAFKFFICHALYLACDQDTLYVDIEKVKRFRGLSKLVCASPGMSAIAFIEDCKEEVYNKFFRADAA
jgi:hypothetical protein